MPWAWVSLLILTSPEPAGDVAATVESPPESASQHAWLTSVQIGAGMLEEDPAGLMRPRLGYRGSLGTLILGLPIWVRFADRAPAYDPTAAVDEASWITDWSSPATYAAMLEELSLSFAGERVRLYAGPVKQETLGYGALVDGFSGSLDPLVRRTGARFDLQLDTVQVELLADSVVDPHLLAAHVTLAPLTWVGWDDESRFRVATGMALDPGAPGTTESAPVGGADLGVGYIFWRSERVALESYLTGAVLSTPGVGGHLGLRLEVATRPGEQDSDAVTLDLEWVLASDGYVPGFFDVAYQAERLEVPSRLDRPKRELNPRAGYGLRGSADVRIGGARFGLSAHSMFRGQLSSSAYLRLEFDAWSVAGMVVKRDMETWDDLVEAGPGTYGVLEAAVRVWDGFFLFATLHHGWREGEAYDRRVVTDWLGGVGYALGGQL